MNKHYYICKTCKIQHPNEGHCMLFVHTSSGLDNLSECPFKPDNPDCPLISSQACESDWKEITKEEFEKEILE